MNIESPLEIEKQVTYQEVIITKVKTEEDCKEREKDNKEIAKILGHSLWVI